MSENEEIVKYPVAEKQMYAVGHPFQVIKDEPRESWRTNYAYYLKQKREGAPLRPLIGRINDDKKFEIYEDGGWIEKDLWGDFGEGVVDKEGKPVIKPNGKQRQQLLFSNVFEFLVKFETPISIEYWNSDLRQKVTEEHEIVWLRCSKNLKGKIEANTKHPRANKEDLYVMKFDDTKAPAEMYSVTLKA